MSEKEMVAYGGQEKHWVREVEIVSKDPFVLELLF